MGKARLRQPANREPLTMRAVVTGAAGFIGSNLVDRLLYDGHQVIGIDNLCIGVEANLEQAMSCNDHSRRFRLLKLDVQAPELTDIVIGANPHVIFHLAAHIDYGVKVSDPRFDARSNVLGTINLCEASRRAGVRRIVYAASGMSRYGASSSLVDETECVDPLSPHAVAKLAGELYLRAYAEMYGLSPICLALANVYGPRQNPHCTAGEIAVLGRAMITGNPYTVYRDGTAARDYIYIDDVVDAFVRAAGAPLETTGTYNVGTGRQVTVTEVYAHIAAALEGVSPGVVAAAGDADEVRALALNSEKAGRDLHWVPKVELAEGIRRTVGWLCAALEPESPALAPAGAGC